MVRHFQAQDWRAALTSVFAMFAAWLDRFKKFKLNQKAEPSKSALLHNLRAARWLHQAQPANHPAPGQADFCAAVWVLADGTNLPEFVDDINAWLEDKLVNSALGSTMDPTDHLISCRAFLVDGEHGAHNTFWGNIKANSFASEEAVKSALQDRWTQHLWPHITERLRRFKSTSSRPGTAHDDLRKIFDKHTLLFPNAQRLPPWMDA